MMFPCPHCAKSFRAPPEAAGRRRLGRHLLVLAGKAARRLEEGTLAPWLAGRAAAWAGR